jgi:hypothetical protein
VSRLPRGVPVAASTLSIRIIEWQDIEHRMIDAHALAFSLLPSLRSQVRINGQRLKKRSVVLSRYRSRRSPTVDSGRARTEAVERFGALRNEESPIDCREIFVIDDSQSARPPIVLTSEDRERPPSLKDAAMEKSPERDRTRDLLALGPLLCPWRSVEKALDVGPLQLVI